MMNINGGQQTQMTQNRDFNIVDPHWSPDGRFILYASDEATDARGQRNYDIWLMSAEGGGAQRITTNGSYDSSPSFDRTGRFVYFRSNRGGYWNVWRIELAAKPEEILSRRPRAATGG
jgi:Tol biopolymer transport system component